MLTLFQKGLLAILALGILLIALVVAAKAPAQATTFAPAVQVPVNAVVPPGIVTTGDAIVRVKPDGAVLASARRRKAPRRQRHRISSRSASAACSRGPRHLGSRTPIPGPPCTASTRSTRTSRG